MEVAGADQNTCIERTLLLSWHLLRYCIAAGPCFLRNDGARMAAQNSYSLPIRQYFYLVDIGDLAAWSCMHVIRTASVVCGLRVSIDLGVEDVLNPMTN